MIDESPQQTDTRPPAPTVRSFAPQIVVGGALVLIGVLWLLERIGVIDVTVTAVLALATIIVGIAVMSLAGRGPHIGLIVFGTMLALVTTITAITPLQGFQGGIGDRVVEVADVGDIEPDYNLAIGRLTIDLRQLEQPEEVVQVTASVGMGELLVRIPEGMPFEVQADSGAGEIEILDRHVDGVGVDDAYQSPSFENAGLSFDLDVFTGRVEVRYD